VRLALSPDPTKPKLKPKPKPNPHPHPRPNPHPDPNPDPARYGLSLTSAAHGAFLIQLTTLIVPLAQGLQGVPIPRRVWTAIGLAVAGVALFTQDPGAAPTAASGVLISGHYAC